MQLAKLEKCFMASLIHQNNDDTEFTSKLLPLELIDEEMQLDIYRNNLNGAHQKVLSQIYPACLNILGEEYFNQLCRVYRIQYPSIDSDLNNYGNHFPLFLNSMIESHEELTDFNYLNELANLEWYWHHCFYVKNDPVFDFSQLAHIEPELHENIEFVLSSSFSLHATTYPLLDIWTENKKHADQDKDFNMPDSEVYFYIIREQFSPKIGLLSLVEFAVLKGISERLALPELMALATDELVTQNLLMSFIEKGWVSSFLVNTNQEL